MDNKLRMACAMGIVTGLCCAVLPNAANAQTKPKIGDWQGEPSVSFTVKADGRLVNFNISVPLTMGSCNMKFTELAVTKAGAILLEDPNGRFFIKGQFKSSTVVHGKVGIKVCPDPEDKNNVVMLVPWEKDWGAKAK